MNVSIEVSIGEFFDKLTILEIKKENVTDDTKLANIQKELDYLEQRLTTLPFDRQDVLNEVNELKTINSKLWAIEDDIREKESQKTFDDAFIDLARSVYFINDKRSDVKRRINKKLGSDFVEEKSYKQYQ